MSYLVHFWDIRDEEGRSQGVTHTRRESQTRPQGEETGQLSHLGEHLLVWKLDNPTKSVELIEKGRVARKERRKVDIEVLSTHPLHSCL